MVLNATLKEVERRLKSNETPEQIAADMNIAPGAIYTIFKIPKLPKSFHEPVGLEPFREQSVPITSKPGWRVLRS